MVIRDLPADTVPYQSSRSLPIKSCLISGNITTIISGWQGTVNYLTHDYHTCRRPPPGDDTPASVGHHPGNSVTNAADGSVMSESHITMQYEPQTFVLCFIEMKHISPTFRGRGGHDHTVKVKCAVARELRTPGL